ncbi:MAG: hypothetical protein HZB50_04730 [Chloroflexi bacterium]|nr:hypothetical protein [Chloroflexota bacterium]
MQPESPTNEIQQPESTGPEGALHIETPVTNVEVHPVTPLPENKNFLSKLLIGGLVLFLISVMLVAGGLGYWAYTLNTDLTKANEQLAALQGKYDSLESENSKLSADLTQSNADLENTRKELSTARKDLDAKTKKSKDAAARFAVLSKTLIPLTKAEEGVASEEEFITFFSDWVQSIENVHDPVLDSKFDDLIKAIMAGKSDDGSFMDYLIKTIEDDLK